MKTILFDLDGTLLPMDQDQFINEYFKLLAKKMTPYGYNPKELIDGIWRGTYAMIKNDGSKTNEEVFWETFTRIFGDKAYQDKEIIDEYYKNEFNNLKDVCGYTDKAKWIIDEIKKMGYKMVLATNPIFPSLAQENRIRFAGLKASDFVYYTSYENMSHSKPNPKYYLEIVEKLNLDVSKCIMVGNDVDEDMIASSIGMKVFLLTPCIINKSKKDISTIPHGDFEDLLEYIKNN